MRKNLVALTFSIILSSTVLASPQNSYCSNLIKISIRDIGKIDKNNITLSKQLDKTLWLNKNEKNKIKSEIRDDLLVIKKQQKQLEATKCSNQDTKLSDNLDLLNEKIRKTYYTLKQVDKNFDLTINEKKDLFYKISGEYFNGQN